jgi:alanyl-tRNA synthetase
MKTSEIRQRFLRFFEDKGHAVLPSDSLVPPAEDKSLLFTGAGMNQFKNEFMGRGKPGLKRAATSQKCFRTGDLDNVGRTAYHHTFFEMLGNFSFGDYFKRDAIFWAWEFLTKEMKLPASRLEVSIYEDDDEAFAIWHKEVGLDAGIIRRYGQHDNFWPADAPKLGPNGLCGPCSEIYYDWGADVGCRKPECQPSCNCGRYMEVWNLVFQQFDRQEGGVLVPLPTKNIDTGMGLERLARVMQKGRTNFDTDLFLPVIHEMERLSEKDYESVRDTRQGVAFRRIADHVRAAAFCVSDGVLPGNSGRGYVLRKLIRRAFLDGGRLGRKEPFLHSLVPVVAKVMGDQYPDVRQRRENIANIIKGEEERFNQTLEQGLALLGSIIDDLRKASKDSLPGEEAFRLFDTYGLPLDVTEAILDDSELKVDREGFEREMTRQRELSRKGTKISADIFGGGPAAELKERGVTTHFEGYEKDEVEGMVLGLLCGEHLREELKAGEEGVVVLDRTTFYAESGGEVGDTGLLESIGGKFEVADTQRSGTMALHVGKVAQGVVRVDDYLHARPSVARRAAIRRNHTATHLLHLALRDTLGKHAEQAGSMVTPERLRFDFHHTQAVTKDELRRIEDLVNARVLENAPVSWRITTIDAARADGAMALFGEKYGAEVRVLSVGDYSKELCGGLHARATGEIGLFKIIGESSVAAGIRRIEAVTGAEALRVVREKEDLLRAVAEALDAQEARLVERAEQLAKQVKDLRKDLQKARQSSAPSAADYLKNARELGGVKVVAAKVEEATADDLRALVDQLRQSAPSIAIAFGAAADGRVNLIVAFSKDLIAKGLHAGKIAGEAAKVVGGGGGGRPDMAQAGGKDPARLDDAIRKAGELIEEKLKG